MLMCVEKRKNHSTQCFPQTVGRSSLGKGNHPFSILLVKVQATLYFSCTRSTQNFALILCRSIWVLYWNWYGPNKGYIYQ